MGKSTSCFKVITCSGDSKDHDDVDVSENKGSSDKRGWSFRKRSSRQRVLSNSGITESPSSDVKESLETAGFDFQPPANSIVPDKNYVTDCTNEKPQLSSHENPNEFEVVVATHDKSKNNGQVEESIAIVIQSAIRGLLAQLALRKLKNVVKLQAAVRGHLVRRHAVGTLRCVQAIVKMQALVRARYSRQSLGVSHQDKLDGKHKQDEKEEFSKPKAKFISIEKLLSNRFAHQLLDSTRKTTPINIKCDPLKSDSSWKWLERWMSVMPLDTGEQKKAGVIAEKPGNKKEENFVSELDNGIDTRVCDSANAISSGEKLTLPSEDEANIIDCNAERLKVQACNASSSLLRESLEQPQCQNTSVSDMKEALREAETAQSCPDQMEQADMYPQLQCQHHPNKHDTENDQPIMKGNLAEQLESDGRKSLIVSRKATNPAFIAAQSKFEELSSTINSGKSTSLSFEENTECHVETDSSLTHIAVENKELNSSENISLPGSRVVRSECGTELSISSTLDSPDRSDCGTFELEHDSSVLVENIPDPKISKNTDVEQVDDMPALSLSNISHHIVDEAKKSEVVISESSSSEITTDPEKIEVKPERNALHQQREGHTETANQAYRLSPEASPRSHITVPESLGTPSSQLSVKANMNKVDKKGANLKRKSLSAGKKSPSNNIHDTGPRSSPDHLPEDQKNGKRRNSFGSARTDNIEQESRDSTSNNSLPHFMQATESARAKLHSNNSPRSSPDIQDRDIYIKKRHSLPGTNGRQCSPRIQRSMFQVPQSTKENERKWQR